jgi:ABC-2 type transport system permease protein
LLRLTYELARTDFKLRFYGSALGYVWTLMRPLMLFGVMYALFSVVLDVQGHERYYAVALLLGLVMYQFVQESTSTAVRSLMAREPIVGKVDFPRLAVPLASIMLAAFNLALNMVPVLIFLLLSGGSPRTSWLEFPVVFAYLGLLALGPVLLLSALFVRYRDVEPIWDVILQIGFYATPIFYTVSTIRTRFGSTESHFFFLNPFAIAVQQARHALVDPSHPSAAQAIGHPVLLAVPLGIVAAVLAVGAWYFTSRAPRIAEEL